MLPSKKVLIVFYSQSGQLAEIVEKFAQPFLQAGILVEVLRVCPKQPFEFPWTADTFFNVMPESVLQIPVEMEEIIPKEVRYDLIVMGYQPWFLSPSIPTTSVLNQPLLQKVLVDTPVVTLIGARNMWIQAQEKIKVKLKQLGTTLVGNIVLVDRHQNHVSAVTILYWMLKGKKERFLRLFPLPGIEEKDIAQSALFGKIVVDHLEKGLWIGLQEHLVSAKAVEVKANLMFIEHRAVKLFSMWANLVHSKKNRSNWIRAYKYYLLIALFGIAPLVLMVNNLFFSHFFRGQINRKKQYYLGLN